MLGDPPEVVILSRSLYRRSFCFFSFYFLYLMFDCITFFLVLSYKVCVLLNNSSAKSVVGTDPALGFCPSL